MIKIDMEMPESCINCKISSYEYGKHFCNITGDVISAYDEKRKINCPLMQYEDEKSCKLTLWDEDSNTYECSECEMKWSLFEGSPNDNGMKFCPECGSKINEIL